MITFEELLKRAKSEKLVVHTPTEKEAKILLKMLDKRGFTWLGGEKLTDMACYEDYKENTCYAFEPNNHVCYSPLNFYQECGYTIIEFSGIVL